MGSFLLDLENKGFVVVFTQSCNTSKNIVHGMFFIALVLFLKTYKFWKFQILYCTHNHEIKICVVYALI